jgi:ABC-2 type transport system ATP-binding protein
MEEWADKPADTFSGGMRRLVAFCMAAVVPGRIVILDEPSNDIDPLRRRLLWEEVRALVSMGSTVLLVTHNVLEAERTVDRLAVINRGTVIGLGTPGSLKGSDGENMRLELIREPMAEMPTAPDFLGRAATAGRRLILRLREADIGPAVQWARSLKETGVVEEYSVGPVTLEDAYLSLVGPVDGRQTPEKEADYDTAAS